MVYKYQAVPGSPTLVALSRKDVIKLVTTMVVIVFCGIITRFLNLEWAGTAAVTLASVTFILLSRGKERLVSSLVISIMLLLISESVVSPVPINTFSPVLVSVLLLFGIYSAKGNLIPPKYLGVGALFVAIFVLSTFTQQDFSRGIKSLGIGIFWLAVVWASAELVKVPDFEVVFTVIVGAGIFLSVLALIECIFPNRTLEHFVFAEASGMYVERPNTILGNTLNRAQTTLAYPIILSVYLAVCITILLSAKSNNIKLRASFISLLALGIIATGSRTGIFVVAASVAVIYIFRYLNHSGGNKTSNISPVFVISFAALLSVSGYFVIRSFLSGDFSLFHRASMLLQTANALASGGLKTISVGGGYDSIQNLFNQGVFQRTTAEVVDNSYATILLTTGVLGFAVFAYVYLYAWMKGSVFLKVLLTSMGVALLFFDGIHWHLITFLLFSFVGISLGQKITK